jgi:hypothetical protein
MAIASRTHEPIRIGALLANQTHLGLTLRNTEQHALNERIDCDRTVIRQARNLDEHRGLRTHTE